MYKGVGRMSIKIKLLSAFTIVTIITAIACTIIFLQLEKIDSIYVESFESVISEMDDATALTLAQEEASKAKNTSMMIANVSVLIAIITSVIASIILVKLIVKPLQALTNHVEQIAQGDLTIEPLHVSTKDEIGKLSTSMNKMTNSLQTMIGNLSDNAGHLSSTSEELMAASEEVTASSAVMLEGAKAGGEAAGMMAISATETASAMEETAHAVQRIASTSQQLHQFASQTEELAFVGTGNITKASDQMTSIYDSTKLTTELIRKLSEQSQEIESITQVITGISDQTNLLALNAAIEAARAGEHGKGFAVVADEVRKLAEESNRSASRIGTLTVEIQNDTKNVEQAIEHSLVNVEQGVGIIDEAGKSFHSIALAIGDMKDQIADVSSVTEEISATTEQVAASVIEIAKASNATKSNADNAYESSAQQLSSLQEISSVAQSLSSRAIDLQDVVTQYRV